MAETDIRTTRFSIQPVYAPREPGTEPKLSGYRVSNQVSKALDQARKAAIADALRKAEVYAKASSVRLGRVEWITEDTGNGPSAPMMDYGRHGISADRFLGW